MLQSQTNIKITSDQHHQRITYSSHASSFAKCSQEGGGEREERESLWMPAPDRTPLRWTIPNSGKYSWDNFVGEYFKVH